MADIPIIPVRSSAVLGSPSGVHCTADRSTTSTTYVDVPDLSFQLAPQTAYLFEFEGAYETSATTVGMGLAVNGPASPTYLRGIVNAFTATSTATRPAFSSVFGAYDAGSAAPDGPGATAVSFRVRGLIKTGVNGGAFSLRFLSETGGTVTIKQGSIGLLTVAA